MKKLFLAVFAVLALGTVASAQSVGTFSASATMPAATTVNFITSEVSVATGAFTPVGNNSGAPLTWTASDMVFDTTNQIWTGDHYYAIDLAPVIGGTPAPGSYSSIVFAYSGETVPAGQTAGGLGTRVVVTPTAVTADGGDIDTAPDEIVIDSERLNNVSTLAVTNASLQGGFLRVYVGLYTGAPVVAGAVPFTNGDRPGAYTGTLTITATLA